MSYRYEEHEGFADLKFSAFGKDLAELFISCWNASLGAMIEFPEEIHPVEEKTVSIEEDDLDFLLYEFLGLLIYYKDAETLVLRVISLSVNEESNGFRLEAITEGERIDPTRHGVGADIKAVTFHELSVRRESTGVWAATVLLDI